MTTTTPPPRVTGLFEAHLTVTDLQRSLAFWHEIVGLEVALELPERGAAFLWIGDPGEAMLGLWALGSMPMALSLHVALRSPLEDVLEACDSLRSAGVTPLSFFGEETDEPSVLGWMPAAAVYFRDPDGHLIEYLAMLDERPRPDRGIATWSSWGPPQPLRIERHSGSREELRALFAEAEDSSHQLDAYLDAGDVVVAVEDGRVVGHLQRVDGVDPGVTEIRNMAVAPAQRGRGIGRRLIAAAIEDARREGHESVVVATAAADVGNLRFYQRAGFRLRAIERDAFTPATGYPSGTSVDGVPLLDRVWLDLDLG
jgi:predicted N-acetyltransferase YhbS/catechol 2,3-dioxygenase-like lactoylglutathione lyase family enzyme